MNRVFGAHNPQSKLWLIVGACGKEPIRTHTAHTDQVVGCRLAEGVANAEDIDKAVRVGFGLRYLVSGPLEQRELGIRGRGRGGGGAEVWSR